MTKVYLGLGSNLLNPSEQLDAACTLLQHRGVLEHIERSSHYDSPAMLPESAPDAWDKPFRNMVVAGTTHLLPEALLEAIKHIEREMGRQDRGFWAPREIDIDILSYGDRVQQSQRLTIPHPQMHLRDFVLLPLAEIAPHWVHPESGQTVDVLIAHLNGITAARCEAVHA